MKIIFFSLSLKNCNFKTMQFLISILYISLISFSLFSQTKDNQINRYLSQNIQKLDLSISDISDLRIYNQHSDQKTGLTYLYLIQRHANLDVYNANAVFVKKKNKVYLTGNRFQKNIKSRVNVEAPFLSPKEALEILVRNLGITNIVESNPLRISKNQYLFDKEFLSQEDIPVDLIYVPYKKQIRLAWDISVYMLDGKHWWSIKIDALTGQEIDRVDWVSSCNYHSLNSNEFSCT